jgi:hypothetical protein
MRVDTAIRLINNLIYKPGWSFTATDHTKRFENTINLHVEYPALNSDRDNAERGYADTVDPFARANFPIVLGDSCTDEVLYRRVIDIIMEIELHEAREFLRVQPTYWAPFHPHNIEGMRRWQRTDGIDYSIVPDLRFGLA